MNNRSVRLKATNFLSIGLLAAGVMFSTTTLACTFAGWTGDATSGALDANSPPPVDGVARYSGLCGLKIDNGVGVLEDESPTAETAVNARFYIFGSGIVGVTKIFEAFSGNDSTGSLITITYDGTNFVFNANNGGSGNVAGQAGWNLVEFAWTANGTMDYWVNANSTGAATGQINTTGTGMESVILGAPDGVTGILTLDAYEARRTSMPGPLLIADANNDAAINVLDIGKMVNEIKLVELANGQPDCNEDGSINVLDIGCTVNILKAAP